MYLTFRKFLVAILTLISTVLTGQNFKVDLGPVIDKKTIKENFDPMTIGGFLFDLTGLYRENHDHFFNLDNGKAYMGSTYTGGKYYQIAVLEKYHTFADVKKLAAESGDAADQKIAFLGFIHRDKSNYTLYSMVNAQTDETVVYVNQLSNDMIALGSPIKIAAFDRNKENGKMVSMIVSENKKSTLICRIVNTRKKENQAVECVVLDENFASRWSKKIDLNTEDKNLRLTDINVDDNGNVYILGMRKLKAYTEVPVIYSYLKNGTVTREEVMGQPGEEVSGTGLFILNGETPWLCGIYSAKGLSGYFAYTVNRETGVLDEKVKAPLAVDGKKIVSPGYSTVMNLVPLGKGKYTMSFERNAVSCSSSSCRYLSYDVWLVTFNEQKETLWQRPVYKMQLGSLNYSVNSHALLSHGDNLYVVYNDDDDNVNTPVTKNDGSTYRGVNGRAVIQQFDDTGKSIKTGLIALPEGANYVTKIKEVFRITDSVYQLRLVFRNFSTSGDGNYRYATLTLE